MQYDSRAETEKLKKEYDRIRITAYFMIAMVICVILVSAFRKFWLTLIIIAVTVFLQLFVFLYQIRVCCLQLFYIIF